MKKIFLIRHAQASFGEDNYDQLSAQGYQQASVLGRHLSDSSIESIVSGRLNRHQQTVERVLEALKSSPRVHHDSAWNEFDHREVFFAHRPDLRDAQTREAWRASLGEDYDATVMRTYQEALHRWMRGEGVYTEAWQDFVGRVTSAWTAITEAPHAMTVVVTSAGPISVLLGQWQALGLTEVARLQTSLWNSGITEVSMGEGSPRIHATNSCPHLEDQPHLMSLR